MTKYSKYRKTTWSLNNFNIGHFISFFKGKILKVMRHQLFTPITLASQEAEIRRLTVRGQPGKTAGKIFITIKA
jgi:hypothetical protein